jgi:hypothetical protein
VPTLADLNPFARRGRTALFLWYHTCVCHKPWYHRSKPRGRDKASAPALTPAIGGLSNGQGYRRA